MVMSKRSILVLSLLLAACSGSSSGEATTTPSHIEVLRSWDLVPDEEIEFRVRFRMLEDWLAVYEFTPPVVRQWVIFTHGILDHIATSRDLIRRLLSQEVGVVAFDLPGHGLSTGARADIDDFRTYGEAWALVLRNTQALRPRTAMGHSTGAAALLTFLQRDGAIWPDRIVLIAPLVRNVFWDLSRFAYTAFGWATPYVPALDNAATRDQEWLKRWRLDPLTGKRLPLTWFRALQAWEERSHGWRRLDGSRLYVIQGTADSVVDWQYNVPFLEDRYPGLNVYYIPGGWHGLQYEISPVQEEFFFILEKILWEGG